MLVSFAHRFIYTKARRTASTSVELLFEPFCLPPNEPPGLLDRDQHVSAYGIVGYRGAARPFQMFANHLPAAHLCAILGPRWWNSCYKFCTVRDPFDRLVSQFHVRRPELLQLSADDVVARFRTWLANNALATDRSAFMILGEFALNDVIRYERLHEDCDRVWMHLGLPSPMPQLSHQRRRERHPELALADYYDASSIELVVKRCQSEFNHFGYSENPST